MVNGEKREMEVVYDTIESDEREEGEIVDDELEDVSDSTIHSPTHAGKSVATSDHLRAVSLSSISEDEVELTRRVKQKRFLTREERRCRYLPLQVECCHRRPEKRKRRRHRSRADSSSDSDVPDRSMVRLLKNAVHISKDAENCQNSLQTRLKALIAGSSGKSQSEDEAETNELRKAALESKKEPEAPLNVTEDKELEELRLEALKSAIIQKHEQRKKKKGENVDKDEVNKENQQNNVMKEKTEQKTVSEPVTTENLVNSVNQSVEEDLDIMRAMLLASISTKISKIPTPDLPKAPSQVNAKIAVRKPVNVVRTVKNDYYNKNRLVFNPKKTINNRAQPIKLPNVAPLIIQVNNDSDSDMDLGTPPEEDPMAKKVEELLKQQRAEIEAKTEQKTVKQKPVEQKPVINNVKPPPKPSLDKSIVKLLPLSQQIEYQKLTQLINSKRRPRARRFSQRNNDKEVGVTKRAFKTKFALSKLNGSHNKVVKPKVEKNAPIALKRTLDDLQVHKDGRYLMRNVVDSTMNHTRQLCRNFSLTKMGVRYLRSILAKV